MMRAKYAAWWLLLIGLIVTSAVYVPGLSGGWIFDDYPNIVNNEDVQPEEASMESLARAALSSPASEFGRPLAFVSFALNHVAGGLDPFGWKVVNLILHLLNGLLVFALVRMLMRSADAGSARVEPADASARQDIVAALTASAWMLLPINLTVVLYIVQRMESLANLFVLAGLCGYVAARLRMMRGDSSTWRGPALCTLSLVLGTLLGLTAKETAVMLPLYAFLVEWLVFGFRRAGRTEKAPRDRRLIALFILVLLLPFLFGVVWQLPSVLSESAWATRDFTLITRLLSEARIVTAYIAWILLPLPQWLSFYHDNFVISTGLITPWTTLAGMLVLVSMAALVWLFRHRAPLGALGLALFLSCHLLTGTFLPLELIFEHRNYFASLGLLLALVPFLARPSSRLPLAVPRFFLLGMLFLWWTTLTAFTAWSWGNPLRLAEDHAARAPNSPRAQYHLGRNYLNYSAYNPDSPFIEQAYAALQRAAALPNASILPEQALIYLNAQLGRPINEARWESLIGKLRAHKPGMEDLSALKSLTKCVINGNCKLARDRMLAAFHAALTHPNPDARLLANYSDYLWNVLQKRALALEYARRAVAAKPSEPAYRITLAKMYLALDQPDSAREQVRLLESLNLAGRLDSPIARLRGSLPP